MNILTVVGARPQFIKAAVVSRALLQTRSDVCETLIHTGQHYDDVMSKIFFDELDIPLPDLNLGIGGGSHGRNTGQMLEKLESVMIDKRPDWVLVYGDTDSTLAGALAAVKLHIPIAHIEAGLRSYNRRMPEEINRVLTDHASSLLFTPTDTATRNLISEGIDESKIHQVGDVMYDAVLHYRARAKKPSWVCQSGVKAGEFVLATIHRAENTDNPGSLQNILKGLGETKRSIILPLHPRTRTKLELLEFVMPKNIYVVPPVGYLEMVWLEANCFCIATDSGGVQKEAYFHRRPCITLREETEWVELLHSKWNTLAGTDSKTIKDAVERAEIPLDESSFYGSGNAAHLIVEKIK